jgi:hypothetical protein
MRFQVQGTLSRCHADTAGRTRGQVTYFVFLGLLEMKNSDILERFALLEALPRLVSHHHGLNFRHAVSRMHLGGHL